MKKYDTLIVNAEIYDGSGEKAYIGDVGITGEKIAAVGKLNKDAGQIINGNGLAVSPGFIDFHTHDDIPIILNPYIPCKIMQGITCSVAGSCGSGIFPFIQAESQRSISLEYSELPVKWNSFSEYMKYLDNEPASLNVVLFAGHTTFRTGVMGEVNREPTMKELAQMKDYLSEAVESGVFGLSSGFYYKPACYAKTGELIELVKIMRGTNCMYSAHIRDEANHILDSIEEAAAIGDSSEIPIEISHLKCEDRKNWGRAEEVLKFIDKKNKNGSKITMDMYPYTASSTSLSAALRGSLYDNIFDGLSLPPQDILIVSSKYFPDYNNLTIEDISIRDNRYPKDVVDELLKKEDVTIVHLNCMSEKDLCTFMKNPKTVFGTDGLHTNSGVPHPRLYGSFPRILGRYIREQKIIPLEEAIQKMTSIPAKRLNIKNRGIIKRDAYADLVLFNPKTIIDKATYADSKQYSEGITDVFVNGSHVVKDSKHTKVRSGKMLRRIDS